MDFFEVLVEFLEGVEGALVVQRLGQDLGHHVSVIHAPIGDDDTEVVALGA